MSQVFYSRSVEEIQADFVSPSKSTSSYQQTPQTCRRKRHEREEQDSPVACRRKACATSPGAPEGAALRGLLGHVEEVPPLRAPRTRRRMWAAGTLRRPQLDAVA